MIALLVLAAATPGATATAVARAEILRPFELRAGRARSVAFTVPLPPARPRNCDPERRACRLLVIDLP